MSARLGRGGHRGVDTEGRRRDDHMRHDAEEKGDLEVFRAVAGMFQGLFGFLVE